MATFFHPGILARIKRPAVICYETALADLGPTGDESHQTKTSRVCRLDGTRYEEASDDERTPRLFTQASSPVLSAEIWFSMHRQHRPSTRRVYACFYVAFGGRVDSR